MKDDLFTNLYPTPNPDGQIRYVLTESGFSVSFASGLRNATEIIIPETREGKPITKIQRGAFSGCESLKKVVIPKYVTEIGVQAFTFCTSLEYIEVDSDNQSFSSENGVLYNKNKTEILCYPKGKTNTEFALPDTVCAIRAYAFSYNKFLKTVRLSNGLNAVGRNAFLGCAITEINLPDTIKIIEPKAFSTCTNLERVRLGKNLESIREQAFEFCPNLTVVEYSSTLASWINIERTSEVFSSPFDLYLNSKLLTDVYVDCVILKRGAFEKVKSLQSVTMSDNVKIIERDAFAQCVGLKSVNLAQVKELDIGVFHSCEALESIVIPPSVTDWGINLFTNCKSLKNVIIGKGVSDIPSAIFSGCSALTDIVIPQNVSIISETAFMFCDNLKTITSYGEISNVIPYRYIPLSTSVDLRRLPISDIENPRIVLNSYKRYAKNLLDGVEYPQQIKEENKKYAIIILKRLFEGAKTDVSLMRYLTNEKIISLGDGMSFADQIDDDWDMESKSIFIEYLNSYTNTEREKAMDELMIDPLSDEGIKRLWEYESTQDGIVLKRFLRSEKEVLVPCFLEGEPITVIGESCFKGNDSVERIVISDGITHIQDKAFFDCPNLREIRIPNTLQSVRKDAFSRCEKLVYNLDSDNRYLGNETNPYLLLVSCSKYAFEIKVHASNVVIGAKAFTSHVSFVTLGDNTQYICPFAFDGCWKIKRIRLGKNVKEIGEGCFYSCSNLHSVYMQNGLISIGENAFSDCALIDVVIPDTVEKIGARAFSGCRSLKKITIGQNVRFLGEYLTWRSLHVQEIVFKNPKGWLSLAEQDAVVHEIPSKTMANPTTAKSILCEMFMPNKFFKE